MVKLQNMHTSTHLWGELEDTTKVNLSPNDKEILSRIPRPLKLQGPKIHQPQITDLVPVKNEPNHSENSDSYVTHGVQLLAYINDLHKIKENRKDLSQIPPLPPLSPPNRFPMAKTPFMSTPSTSQNCGKLLNLPCLSQKQARVKLKKSVAVLSAFHGYEQSTDAALDVLTDATHQYLSKFCNLLRAARDNELNSSSKCGFPDSICRVYAELGLGSILDIGNYYKTAIIAKHKAIGEMAETLAFECHHHLDNSENEYVQNGSLQLMMGDDPDNIPEIHFPSSEEGDNLSGPPTLSLDHNAPQIETGLQMLQSLEQYGSLDPSMVTPPPPSSAQSMAMEECEQPMSHDSNAALLLATVSPGSSSTFGNCRKRRKTSEMYFTK